MPVMKDRIKHVVVLMLENRGFDHVLGWLYDNGEQPAVNLPPGSSGFQGLYQARDQNLNNRLLHGDQPMIDRGPIKGASAPNVPDVNPHEDYAHVSVQLFGDGTPPTPTDGTPTMKGFVTDFATRFDDWPYRAAEALPQITKIMETFTPDQLPVLAGLARHYAVCDAWFSSVPTQTNANRAYSLAGTSLGLVDNGFYDTTTPGALPRSWRADDRFDTATLMNVLEDAGQDWRVYYHDTFPPYPTSLTDLPSPFTQRIFPQLHDLADVDQRFRGAERFYDDARAGRLPAVTIIEPGWTFANSYEEATSSAKRAFVALRNDYHPPSDVTIGELFVKRVYDAITANTDAWGRTLLIVTFDEHGGTYDHVPPTWGAMPPWGTDGSPPSPTELGFRFDRYGVRVPTILISPWIEKGTVFRSAAEVPYDHTSVIKTILQWLAIDQPWGLGERVKGAPTFDTVLTRTSARTDVSYGPRPADTRGDTIKWGDAFLLQNERGEYAAGAEEYFTYWYPTLGDATSCALLSLIPGDHDGISPLPNQPIANGAAVQLQSLEDMLGAASVLNVSRTKYCYYAAAGDDAARWRAFLWGYVNGDVTLRYGDTITLINEWWYHQRLARSDDDYLTTEAAFARWTLLKPLQLDPGRGDVIRYGDPVTLRTRDNRYLGAMIKEGIPREYFPTVGERGRAVTLQLLPGTGTSTGEIDLGAAVRIQTSEPEVGEYNLLGAWLASRCYYYQAGNYAEEQWRVTIPGVWLRRNAPAPKLRYGDGISLTNVAYAPQRLTLFPEERYDFDLLTTAAGASDVWFLDKP